MLPTRRLLLGAALGSMSAASLRAAGNPVFTPEAFGAKGDGRTNDSLAMARLAAAVNRSGGGTIVFRRTTYRVGDQGRQLSGPYLFQPRDLLLLEGLSRPLRIEGNGARLLCAPGLRYGVFGEDGAARRTAMPYLGGGLAAPYRAMVEVRDCTGSIHIADLDLEGPGDALVIGGQYGDTGWQLPGTGLALVNNRGGEVIERVRTHKHPLDGLLIDGVSGLPATIVRSIREVTADRNGRQGCSIVGGERYDFARCTFSQTGRGRISSAPGAGVDIEAEGGKRIRDLRFTGCRFVDNFGCGMVADSGDSAGVRFVACTFIGTTSWSAWPSKPRFSFDQCTFVGPVVRAYGAPDPAIATRFTRSIFTDDPARSPTGKVYGGTNADGPLADLSDSRNVTFDRCRFRAVRGVLPWSTGAIYQDCEMVQGMQTSGFPRGRFVGRNTIVGKVDLYGSTIAGNLIVNGVPLR